MTVFTMLVSCSHEPILDIVVKAEAPVWSVTVNHSLIGFALRCDRGYSTMGYTKSFANLSVYDWGYMLHFQDDHLNP